MKSNIANHSFTAGEALRLQTHYNSPVTTFLSYKTWTVCSTLWKQSLETAVGMNKGIQPPFLYKIDKIKAHQQNMGSHIKYEYSPTRSTWQRLNENLTFPHFNIEQENETWHMVWYYSIIRAKFLLLKLQTRLACFHSSRSNYWGHGW